MDLKSLNEMDILEAALFIIDRPVTYQELSEIIQKDEIDTLAKKINTRLNAAYDAVHGSECPFPLPLFYENWEEIEANYTHVPINTGVKEKTLISLARKLDKIPASFALNPKLERQLQKRLQKYSYDIVEAIQVIGGTNIQFAHDPKTGRVVVIEINPRTSRSSALASKATGFPIAFVSSLLAGE